VRPTSPQERNAIKAVCARAVRQIGGSELAKDTRVSEPQISRYLSIGQEKDFMPLDVVADLERIIGHPVVSEHMASLHGFRIVPDGGAADHPDMEDVSQLSDTQGRLLSLLIKGAMDGKYDLHETREILPVAEALAAQLGDLIKGLKIVGSGR
jgi:hypothetical protein